VEHPGAVWEPYCATHHSAEEELIDFENRHRGEISKRLIKYAGEAPSLIARLTEVLELSSLTEPQVVAIESFTERIGSLNEAIRSTINAEDAPLSYSSNRSLARSGLFRANAPEEGEIFSRTLAVGQRVARQSMINSRDPIHEGERRTLSVASRDRGHGLVTRIKWFEVFEIGPAAHGGNGRRFAEPGESEGQVSEMRMNDVEVVGALVYVREHRELQEGSKILLARRAQRLLAGRM
jgi:hypothetical protein